MLLFTTLWRDGQIVVSPYPDPKVAGSVNPDGKVTVTPNLVAQVSRRYIWLLVYLLSEGPKFLNLTETKALWFIQLKIQSL